jgi:hypothetical protein
MGATMEVTYKEIERAFPWITQSITFSDQCGDYHLTPATIFNHEIGRLTGISVIRVEHTEPGEGKGEVDVRFGILAQKFVTSLAHHDRESAAQLFRQIDSTKAPNDFVVETAVDRGIFNDSHRSDRGIFKGGCGKATPLLSSSQCIEYHVGGGVTVFEVYGYGEGTHISLEDLRPFDFYGVMSSANGTGSFAVQTSQGSMLAAARHSYRDKEESSAALSKKQGERKVARNEKVVETKRAMKAVAA